MPRQPQTLNEIIKIIIIIGDKCKTVTKWPTYSSKNLATGNYFFCSYSSPSVNSQDAASALKPPCLGYTNKSRLLHFLSQLVFYLTDYFLLCTLISFHNGNSKQTSLHNWLRYFSWKISASVHVHSVFTSCKIKVGTYALNNLTLQLQNSKMLVITLSVICVMQIMLASQVVTNINVLRNASNPSATKFKFNMERSHMKF